MQKKYELQKCVKCGKDEWITTKDGKMCRECYLIANGKADWLKLEGNQNEANINIRQASRG